VPFLVEQTDEEARFKPIILGAVALSDIEAEALARRVLETVDTIRIMRRNREAYAKAQPGQSTTRQEERA